MEVPIALFLHCDRSHHENYIHTKPLLDRLLVIANQALGVRCCCCGN